MLAIFKRELAAYFRNITGFIFMGFFLLISGLIFTVLLVLAAAAFVFFTIRSLIISIGAAVLGGGVIVLFHLIDPVNYEGFIIRFLRWFSLLARYRDFNIGVLGLSPIVYYLSFCSAFIFLTVRVIEKKRWK